MTLMEVVVASILLASGMSVLLYSFTFAGKTVYTARNQSSVLHFAREQVEARRRYNFRDPNLAVGTYNITTAQYQAKVVISTRTAKEKLLTAEVVWSNIFLKAVSTARYETVIADSIH